MKASLLWSGLLMCLVLLPGCGSFMRLEERVVEMEVAHVPETPLSVRVANGKIAVSPGAGEVVKVTATVRCTSSERLEATEVQPVRLADGTLSVEVLWPEGRRHSREGCDLAIEIPGTRGLSLNSSNGAITVEGQSGPAQLSTSNGSVRVVHHDGPVEADTSNGRITAETIAGAVKAETSNGSVGLREVNGEVEVKTSNGAVEIGLTSGNVGPVRAVSSNGSVTLSAGGLRGLLDLDTRNGQLTVGSELTAEVLEQSKTHRRLRLGGVDQPVSSLKTSNGAVTVRP